MKSTETQSKALEVNLRRTAVDVVIPEEQLVLLDITSELYGVQQNTRKLLHEINHRYVGWAQTLEDLHRRAMSDFAHYIQHERAPEAIGIFCSLYAKVAEEVTSSSLREAAIRKQLYYLEKVVRESGERLALLQPALAGALSRLAGILEGEPSQAVVASPSLKRLGKALIEGEDGSGAEAPLRSLELLAAALREVYRGWLRCEDPVEWWQARPGVAPGAPLPEELAAISHARLEACREQLEQLTDGGGPLTEATEALFALPDNAQIERGYLDAAACVESEQNEDWQNKLERIQWLIKVLSAEALAAVHERALAEINHSYADVLQAGDRSCLEHFVHETFAILRRSELSSSQTAFSLIAKIGLEVLATKDADWVDLVIDEILDWDFPSPEFSGFTDEWQVRVNPAHLRAIRTYLTLIEADPQLARRLVTALVVHLKIGGVFIADTDLFQKDISRLLNSGIGDVYHQVKHLLKIFPVYFNDIGAEGELREVSSAIDEVAGRRDPLCHFLRKQCHVESNPLLMAFIEAIGHFWATGDREPLRPYVPARLYESLDGENQVHRGLRRVFSELVGSKDVRELFALELPLLQRRLKEISSGEAVDREKAELLFKLRKLVGRKYELDHGDLLERLETFPHVAEGQVEALREALEEERHEAALEILLGVLECLTGVIVSEERTEAVEDIYHKRHIAVGIPSMYGCYREEKFEATGLGFRVESLANVLFERLVLQHDPEYVTRNTLQSVLRALRLMHRALRVDGCRGRGLGTGISMLEQALLAEGISIDQYVNIFQFISRSVEQLIRIRFLDAYESSLQRILRRMLSGGALRPEDGADAQETILKISEEFLRDLIAQSFGLQQVDNLVSNVLRALVQGREKLDRTTLNLLMTCDADRCYVAIDRQESPQDSVIYLGNKGYLIKRLAHDGLPVPHGFILTTELFRCRAAILACDELRRESAEQIRLHVGRLETLTGSRFGDPGRPLLLSVRSSAAISMPGILDTFLNVGINEKVAEGLAARPGSEWGAWDAYRRFLQFWGMGHGVDRDLFDALMRDAKRQFAVEKKSHLPPHRMRTVALQYRDFLLDHNVDICEDPYEQVQACIDLVLNSWSSKKARVYRGAMQIAEEWGTAVIVQSMVYGNLNQRSGTGVTLTCDPRRASGEVQLYGDFVAQGQGEDVVSGLVETFPISEAQRLSEPTVRVLSLEKDYPAVYRALVGHARFMIHEQGFFHQELEFTFEGDELEDLYVLQTRDAVLSQVSTVPAFMPTEELERARVATGIGAAGGALSGRAAHTAEDIADLRRRFPEDPIILLRPDTVPDDIPLILQADGMLTAIGGATSHAAVVAQRLGRTCVVGCRQLQVFRGKGGSELAGQTIATGDFISINGSDGSVYFGKHPSTMVRRRRLA